MCARDGNYNEETIHERRKKSSRLVSTFNIFVLKRMISIICFSKKRPGMLILIREFERKISAYYGTEMELVALTMDTWLCPGFREIDNVILFLEPTPKKYSESD